MMRVLTVLCAIALVGCGTNPVIPETVKIPIMVPCKVQSPVEPTYRYQPPYDNVFDGVRDLLGDREIALAYENELRVALKSCQ